MTSGGHLPRFPQGRPLGHAVEQVLFKSDISMGSHLRSAPQKGVPSFIYTAMLQVDRSEAQRRASETLSWMMKSMRTLVPWELRLQG